MRPVRKTGLGLMAVSGSPDRISARLETGSPRLLDPCQKQSCRSALRPAAYDGMTRRLRRHRNAVLKLWIYCRSPASCRREPAELTPPSPTVRLQVTTARPQPAGRWPPRSPPTARMTAATPRSAPRLGSAIGWSWGRMATALPQRSRNRVAKRAPTRYFCPSPPR